jgi:ribosomal protein L37AE/L43A
MTDDLNRNPLTQFLAHLSKAEQLQVMMTHPFFTGCCPNCGHDFPRSELSPQHWHCRHCGWLDLADNSIQPPQLAKLQSRGSTKRLGAYLVDAGLLTYAQVEMALAEQATAGTRLGDILVKRGYIQHQALESFIQQVVKPEREAHHPAPKPQRLVSTASS